LNMLSLHSFLNEDVTSLIERSEGYVSQDTRYAMRHTQCDIRNTNLSEHKAAQDKPVARGRHKRGAGKLGVVLKPDKQ